MNINQYKIKVLYYLETLAYEKVEMNYDLDWEYVYKLWKHQLFSLKLFMLACLSSTF